MLSPLAHSPPPSPPLPCLWHTLITLIPPPPVAQSDDFVANNFNTDWLDGRIARHKQLSLEEAERFCPTPTVVAACGAALQGYQHFVARDGEFVDMLRVGQVPSKDTLSPEVAIDLIFNNVKVRPEI